ncbi:MAG: hypothetical protein IKB38_06720 [Clostridia bacterium]|nr:hypothetical protein [Clostridia bacterium]
MELNQPYYIDVRRDACHLELDGEWSFFFSDTEIDEFTEDMWKYRATMPRSVYHALSEAGILPDPYFGTNSEKYTAVDEKIWYFRKKFNTGTGLSRKRALLSFDGVAYYSRTFINGVLLGEHEGMFGGPAIDVTEHLNFGDENELIVEIKACNFGKKGDERFVYRGDGNIPQDSPIVPWNVVHDKMTTNGHFIVLGIWNRVRLEFVEPLHVSRPYLYTEEADERRAILHLEMEITDGTVPDIKSNPSNVYKKPGQYVNTYNPGLTGAVLDRRVEIITEISEPDTGKVIYKSSDEEALIDYERLGIKTEYREMQYFRKNITIDFPRLWYPYGMGEPYLYNVKISLCENGKLLDTHELRTGIRTFGASPTAGRKYRHRWENFRFSVNGRHEFLKGINWMQTDFLYLIDEKEYRWCLTLIKNAGIQLIRVWNGGCFPESDVFYRLCDEMGIMVWQDLMLANTADTRSFSQKVLEDQVSYNLYRIRNHPSLVLICGGNEFQPYADGNAAAVCVQDRATKALVPHLLYHTTTPDKGSAHIYNDFEPTWYRHNYRELPFLAESGIHSFPSFSTWKKCLFEDEINSPLPDIASEEFTKKFPSLLNHFVEYLPERVPRMLARASQIVNMNGVSLEELSEATQVQAYEFYSVMIDSMRANYPRCGGVMPWVFKRSWTTVGIQLVDGAGQAAIQYYAVKNAFSEVKIAWEMPWTVTAPKEPLPLSIAVLSDERSSLSGSQVRLTVFKPDMSTEAVYEHTLTRGERHFSFGDFIPSEDYTDKCFLVFLELEKDGKSISEATCFIKVTSALCNAEIYKKYRTSPTENMYFEKGPWLKESVGSARRAKIKASLIRSGACEDYRYYDVRIENVSDVAAYPVTLHLADDFPRHFESESFFLLPKGGIKTVRITTDCESHFSASDIEIKAWNADTVHAKET